MRATFGDFVLDTGTRELSRGGRRLDLTPKAFDLLAMLIAHTPRVVTKTELQERLWPDRFVVDKNLANLVSEIRDALGEVPSAPRFIRTAHRIGYAFRSGDLAEASRGRGQDSPAFRLLWDDQRLALHEGEYVLGRDPDADVYLASPSVSRRHAVIRVAGRRATIEDLGSRNGTFVGQRRVDATSALENGDTIRLGSVAVTFRAALVPGSTKSIAPDSSRRKVRD
jgi:DNA-binding winged helix-turn-helix (wHTH) protein